MVSGWLKRTGTRDKNAKVVDVGRHKKIWPFGLVITSIIPEPSSIDNALNLYYFKHCINVHTIPLCSLHQNFLQFYILSDVV